MVREAPISNPYTYAGFISYAHADEAIAARLHKALETYPIPKSFAAQHGLEQVRKKLAPIFRDTTELTAHHSLSEKIREAVQSSRFLIAICSPAAKMSHWVNEEIRLFRSLHGEGAILCVLAEGTPETSFPPALREDGREPLAANIGGAKENFKQGTTQLAASMLGVGLDVLIQRQAKRRRRRMQLITASALAFSAFMGGTTLTAIDARNEAQESRSQAEGLVEYMITDLKDKLEPLGKLEILEGVGKKATEYYDNQDITELSDESLLRQARARHVLGEVAYDAARKEDTIREIGIATEITTDVLKRNPDDPQAIYAHAQSEYWQGKIYYGKGEREGVLEHWKSYEKNIQKLYESDPSDIQWLLESGYTKNALGNISSIQKKYEQAFSNFEQAIVFYDAVLSQEPDHRKALSAIANSYGGAAIACAELRRRDEAFEFTNRQIEIYSNLLLQDQRDYQILYKKTLAQERILRRQLVPKNSNTYNKLVEDVSEGFKIATQRDPSNSIWKRNHKEFREKFLSEKSVNQKKP